MAEHQNTLHLTNGTAIIGHMRASGVTGQIVPWDDVLHEGPVPAGLGPAALRERRADFLSGCGWGSRETIARDLEVRDSALDEALASSRVPPLPTRLDEVVLWFEHDLYDQLQLIQILDRVPSDGGPRVTAVPAETYLGQLPREAFPGLFAGRRFVSSAERVAARDAWTAFRSPDPRAVADVLPRVTVLPHLGAALTRHLEQFPSVTNGLSRTEQQTLESVAGGVGVLRDVFVQANHHREAAVFMGDAAFLVHISSLIRNPRPLLRIVDATFSPADEVTLGARVELTDDGVTVLAAGTDRVELCGIDRWLGGVHLQGNGPVWRWDVDRASIRFV